MRVHADARRHSLDRALDAGGSGELSDSSLCARVRERILEYEPLERPFELSGRYRRWLTRAMSLSVSEACAGLGEGTFSSVVLIM
jgi:hypothetical protein